MSPNRAVPDGKERGPILVTGATGFTGSHLVRQLAGANQEVIAFVRPTSDTGELERLGVECRVVDIREAGDVKAHFQGFGTVYHLAAAFREEHPDVEEFQRVNVCGTRHMLEAARAHGVRRFVHCSTVGVQGHIEDPPATEDYRTAPGDHYQRSKLEGERLARQRMDAGPMEVTVIRPCGIYGPGDRRFLKLFQAIAGGRFIMAGAGETLYHMTYIEDLVRGLRLAGRHPAAPGEVFTIAGPSYTSLSELVALIARTLDVREPRWRVPYRPLYAAAWLCQRVSRVLGVRPILYPRRVEFFSKDRAFDIAKAKRLLGYEPRTGLAEGVARTAAWYREQGFL